MYTNIGGGGGFSTREVVLKRDGTGVVQGSDCAAVSGTWFSPYDGATWTVAGDLVCYHTILQRLSKY